MFQLFAQHYRRLVQVIGFSRVMPLLEEWSAEIVHYSKFFSPMENPVKWLDQEEVKLLKHWCKLQVAMM
jgi:hypothetical protein